MISHYITSTTCIAAGFTLGFQSTRFFHVKRFNLGTPAIVQKHCTNNELASFLYLRFWISSRCARSTIRFLGYLLTSNKNKIYFRPFHICSYKILEHQNFFQPLCPFLPSLATGQRTIKLTIFFLLFNTPSFTKHHHFHLTSSQKNPFQPPPIKPRNVLQKTTRSRI